MAEIVNHISTDEWMKFLQACDSATIYHTPEWKSFLEDTFNYEPKYLFALDSSGNLTGLLPLFYVSSRITGKRLSSLPFSHVCAAIGTTDSINTLLDEAIKLHIKLGSNYLEIRDSNVNDSFTIQNSFSTYILELSSNTDEIWRKLDKGSTRWAVKKSQKNGVEVIKTNDIEDVKDFYELNCRTKKDLGVPCHPWKFFKNLFKHMNNYVSLYMAVQNNKKIGGGIMEYYKDNVIYGYGAADPDALKSHPYNAFIWKSIEDACGNGFKHYDFGRTSYSNTGLSDFKMRWGTTEKKLFYAYYPNIQHSLANTRTSWKYSLLTGIIKNTPMLPYKCVSSEVFKYFG